MMKYILIAIGIIALLILFRLISKKEGQKFFGFLKKSAERTEAKEEARKEKTPWRYDDGGRKKRVFERVMDRRVAKAEYKKDPAYQNYQRERRKEFGKALFSMGLSKVFKRRKNRR